jgi:hypothetical protein
VSRRGRKDGRGGRPPTIGGVTVTLHVVHPPASIQGGGGAPGAGLCETCRFRREVRNTRGSSFSLCERSREDPAYPRYPRLPVLDCAGYERDERGAHGSGSVTGSV